MLEKKSSWVKWHEKSALVRDKSGRVLISRDQVVLNRAGPGVALIEVGVTDRVKSRGTFDPDCPDLSPLSPDLSE